MGSRFAIAGHPIHPMLVALPIGLFVWTLVGDIAYLASGKDHMWYDIAFWSGVAAILGALVAALPGFGDYLTVAARSTAQRIGLMHMVLNLGVVGLYFVAMLLMRHDGAIDGSKLSAVVALHAIGAGVLVLSGWLGAEMVYIHHIGIQPEDAEIERAEHARHDRVPGQLNP